MTGSHGLIGTVVCAVLLSRGNDVRRFDVADQRGGFGNILNPADLKSAMKDCAGVIHLAAVSRVIWGERDPQKCHETNVVGTRNIIDCMNASDPKPWLIFASSREVYGQSAWQPVTEDMPLRPMNHYARSKVEAERAIARARDGGLCASVLRFSTVYGAIADHPDRVIPQFCRSALTDRPIAVEGAKNTLDITHVADVADCIANVANSLSQGGSFEPMHLTTGHATSLQSLAQTVVRLAQSNSEIVVKEPRNFDVENFVGHPRLAKTQIGWQPKTALETGIGTMIAQFLESGTVDVRETKDFPIRVC